MIAAAC